VSNFEEKTEIIHGEENTIKRTLDDFLRIREKLDSCIDSAGPSVIITTDPVRNAFVQLKKRGIKLRWITEITPDNIQYCKDLLRITDDVRHLSGVKGNFGVTEFSYAGSATNQVARPLPQLIYTTVKSFVELQQYFFDMLWNKAVPATQKIREIEEGEIPNLMAIVAEPSEILRISYDLVKAAKDEILIVFHTANALLRQNRSGGIELLIESAIKYKTQVKILVPFEDRVMDVISRLQQIKGIEIRNIEPTMQTRVTILVTDRKYSIVVELKDDSKEKSEEAIGLATYSTSKSTVLSYVSIFETLWRQSELREELMIRTIAQKDFISIAAHELRNPIQPILGLSDVLQRSENLFDNGISKDSRAKQKEMIDIIARNAKRLQRLTDDILDVTRIEGKTLNLNKESFVLARTLKDLVQDYSTEFRNSNRNLKLLFSSSKEIEATTILADQNRIKQVISNLIDNAIKFTREGFISITAATDKKYRNVIVKVIDSGTGIDSDMLPRLFTKFATKSEGGTGLGLYICKGIIETHGGRIWAENNSAGNSANDSGSGGTGATFSFELPLTVV
jgi:signal transduction histidine kinase